jgi:hypothetical protein
MQVGLLNVDGFYNSLLSFIDKAVDEGFISPAARRIIVSAPTAEQLVRQLEVDNSFLYTKLSILSCLSEIMYLSSQVPLKSLSKYKKKKIVWSHLAMRINGCCMIRWCWFFYYMVDLHYLIIVFGYLFPLSLLLQDYVPEYDEITAKLVWEEVDRLTAWISGRLVIFLLRYIQNGLLQVFPA